MPTILIDISIAIIFLDLYAIFRAISRSHGVEKTLAWIFAIIAFPGVGAIILPYLAWKYDMGLYRVNDMWLYTNRGLGVTNIPARFNCPPEITEIRLVRA